MIHVYKLAGQIQDSSAKIPPQSWVHVVTPTDDELSQIAGLGIPSDFLSHAFDANERSRVLQRDDLLQVVVRLPHATSQSSDIPYITAPLSIFLIPERIVTIESTDIGLLPRLEVIKPDSASSTAGIHFVMTVLSLSASEFLRCLEILNSSIEEVEARLQRSLRNREVLQLLNIQKSLVHFITALRSIEALIEKLRRVENLHWSGEEERIAEDSLIEIRQAIYQVEIAENILTQMMDAFASIVSNNLNTVMKFLAAITIVISVPMLIASLYGMNVPLPGGSAAGVFGIILAISIVLSLLVIFIFRKLDWL
jgi:magnesium transporter